MPDNYEDIIRLPHHQSDDRQPMPLRDRAAQFAPFAALTGFDGAIAETARLTDRRIEPDEEAASILNLRVCQLRERLHERPAVTLTCFIPDKRKSGGSYATIRSCVRRIDDVAGEIVLTDKTVVPLADIIRIDL